MPRRPSGLRKAGAERSTREAEGGLPVHHDFSEHKKAGYEVRFNPLEPSERGCRFASFKNPSERACFNGLCVIAQLALSTNLALIKYETASLGQWDLRANSADSRS